MLDHVHPNRLGRVLFADLLATYFLEADKAKRTEGLGLRTLPRLLPTNSFMPTGREVYLMRCYGQLVSSDSLGIDAQLGGHGSLNIINNTGFVYSKYTVSKRKKRVS